MHLQLTAGVRPVPEGYLGGVEELTGANVQQATLDSARASLGEPARPMPGARQTLARDAGDLVEVTRDALVIENVRSREIGFRPAACRESPRRWRGEARGARRRR